MEEYKPFNLYEHHYKLKPEILISYKGPFDKEVLTIISNYIKVVIGKDPLASKKLFRIFIELAQNVARYSTNINKLGMDKDAGSGSLVILELPDHYSFITGNVIKQNDVDDIIKKCDKINSLDTPAELRAFKREQLRKTDSEREGANIGLIQVALTSENPLGYELSRIDDDFSFFTITVKIDK